MDRSTLYDDDIVAWAEQQAAALRTIGARADLSDAIDWENVAEEIESVGRSQARAVESLLVQTLDRLLKRLSAPDAPANLHWRSEIAAFQLAARIRYEPAMARRIGWKKVWTNAMDNARTGLEAYGDTLLPNLPASCPLPPDILLGGALNIDEAILRIARSAATS